MSTYVSKKAIRYRIKKKLSEEELETQLKSTQGSLGGKTKQINKLTKEKEELEVKLKEYMTDKYLVKKIPSGKTPNLQKTKITQKVNPKVQRYMKKLEEEKEGV